MPASIPRWASPTRRRESFSAYLGYNEGSRAPSSIELGCADPANPCKLPNAMAGDPPLKQVVAKTFEIGMRGTALSELQWNLGVFRANNYDDILFVADNPSGFGYFRNFGQTRRQGVEAGLSGRAGIGRLRRELHVPRGDVSEQRDPQRRRQQQQRRTGARIRRQHRDPAREIAFR